MSSCSYLLNKSEFDRLMQNDPAFQKLVAIYEPGRPKNKSDYGFMMDMLTLHSATKNDKMMRKKSRIAAQYNGTYTKNEPILDRLSAVENLIDEMEKAGCGYGLRDYYNQQKLKQQPTTANISQPTANVKAKTIMDCLVEAINKLSISKKIDFALKNCSMTQPPAIHAFGYTSIQGPAIFDIELRHYFPDPKSIRGSFCDVQVSFNSSDILTDSYIDEHLKLKQTNLTQEDKWTLKFAYIFNKVYKRIYGQDDADPCCINYSISYQTF